jgi:hypothetical protein
MMLKGDVSMSAIEEPPLPLPPTPRGRLALWLAGSAMLGSAALVLWNLRTLKALREAADHPVEPERTRDDDGIY